MVNKRIYTQITQMAHRFIIVFFFGTQNYYNFPIPPKNFTSKIIPFEQTYSLGLQNDKNTSSGELSE